MKQLHGLYAITDTGISNDQQLLNAARQAIQGGARILQYRNKTLAIPNRQHQAELLLHECQKHSIPLIVNDDIALAAAIGADGVHLGRGDGDITQARKQLGNNSIIGVSCYNDAQLAQAAVTAGADYVAFGAFFPSSTKPQAVRAPSELLTWAKRELDIPVVAIGGVTAQNGAALIEAGADMLAVIQGIFGQPDIHAAAQRYARLF